VIKKNLQFTITKPVFHIFQNKLNIGYFACDKLKDVFTTELFKVLEFFSSDFPGLESLKMYMVLESP